HGPAAGRVRHAAQGQRPEETGSEPGPATPPQEAEAPTAPSVPLTVPPPSPAPAAGPGAGEAAEVLVPTAPMLADPLGVQRAVRPPKRRVPSWHRTEMDEDATAARIADTGLWTPVLVPSPERRLSLALVVDTGPTMRRWRPLARELAETLLRQGAFQDVHVSYLQPSGHLTSAPGAPPQDPGTLLDPSGRRAVLVLSDCSGPHWWDGRAARAVRRWAHAGPTAILQPLAEHLWRRTAAPASPGLAVLPRPGAPNTELHFTPHDGAVAPRRARARPGGGAPLVRRVGPSGVGGGTAARGRHDAAGPPAPVGPARTRTRTAGRRTRPPLPHHRVPGRRRTRRARRRVRPVPAGHAAHPAPRPRPLRPRAARRGPAERPPAPRRRRPLRVRARRPRGPPRHPPAPGGPAHPPRPRSRLRRDRTPRRDGGRDVPRPPARRGRPGHPHRRHRPLRPPHPRDPHPPRPCAPGSSGLCGHPGRITRNPRTLAGSPEPSGH